MAIIIKDKKKYDELTMKIFKGQILLDRLKEMVKEGHKNIKILRQEKAKLRTQTKPKTSC